MWNLVKKQIGSQPLARSKTRFFLLDKNKSSHYNSDDSDQKPSSPSDSESVKSAKSFESDSQGDSQN